MFGVLVVQTVRPKLFLMKEIKTLLEAGYRVLDVIAETAQCCPLTYSCPHYADQFT